MIFLMCHWRLVRQCASPQALAACPPARKPQMRQSLVEPPGEGEAVPPNEATCVGEGPCNRSTKRSHLCRRGPVRPFHQTKPLVLARAREAVPPNEATCVGEGPRSRSTKRSHLCRRGPAKPFLQTPSDLSEPHGRCKKMSERPRYLGTTLGLFWMRGDRLAPGRSNAHRWCLRLARTIH